MDVTKPAGHRKSKRDFRYAESQLRNLNTKIDKLLNKLDEKEQDEAKTPEEECVICVNSKATMQTWPCGHRVVCRKCLVRTIQMAVSRRSLPLRCVVCRARVLRLKRSPDGAAATSADDAVAAAAADGRSHSLPAKLRRRRSTGGSVAVRSRSVGTGKTGHRRRSAGGGRGGVGARRYKCPAAGWSDPFGEDDGHDDGGGGGGDDDDDDDDNYDRNATSIKYSKLDAEDKRHGTQSKNGLQKIISKFKFWRFLRFKNNKL